MALMAIPFRSLRFRPNGSDWGVVFGRNVFEGARPNDFLAALGEIVRKGAPASEAAKIYGF